VRNTFGGDRSDYSGPKKLMLGISKRSSYSLMLSYPTHTLA
jgi:hypothetical protein